MNPDMTCAWVCLVGLFSHLSFNFTPSCYASHLVFPPYQPLRVSAGLSASLLSVLSPPTSSCENSKGRENKPLIDGLTTTGGRASDGVMICLLLFQ